MQFADQFTLLTGSHCFKVHTSVFVYSVKLVLRPQQFCIVNRAAAQGAVPLGGVSCEETVRFLLTELLSVSHSLSLCKNASDTKDSTEKEVEYCCNRNGLYFSLLLESHELIN